MTLLSMKSYFTVVNFLHQAQLHLSPLCQQQHQDLHGEQDQLGQQLSQQHHLGQQSHQHHQEDLQLDQQLLSQQHHLGQQVHQGDQQQEQQLPLQQGSQNTSHESI